MNIKKYVALGVLASAMVAPGWWGGGMYPSYDYSSPYSSYYTMPQPTYGYGNYSYGSGYNTYGYGYQMPTYNYGYGGYGMGYGYQMPHYGYSFGSPTVYVAPTIMGGGWW